jgi:hypothetical protein
MLNIYKVGKVKGDLEHESLGNFSGIEAGVSAEDNLTWSHILKAEDCFVNSDNSSVSSLMEF